MYRTAANNSLAKCVHGLLASHGRPVLQQGVGLNSLVQVHAKSSGGHCSSTPGMHPTVPSSRNPQVLPNSHRMAAHSDGSVSVGGVESGMQPTDPSARTPQPLPTKQLIAAHSGGSVCVGGVVKGRQPTAPSGRKPQVSIQSINEHSGGSVRAWRAGAVSASRRKHAGRLCIGRERRGKVGQARDGG
jgi:hypothetical protein